MKISIGESYPNHLKPIAWLTKKVEGVEYSHCFISWKDNIGLRWVAEARGSGLQIISNVEFKQENNIINIYEYECDEEQYKKAMTYVWQESHKEYSKRQIAGLLWMRLANRFARALCWEKRFQNPFRDGPYSQICCEFAINTLTTAMGIEIPGDVENYGLIETRRLNEKYGLKLEQAIIDRINGK